MQKSLLSLFYSCQQKKFVFIQRFDQAQTLEERYYWLKQMNKNDLEIEAIKILLNEQELVARPFFYAS